MIIIRDELGGPWPQGGPNYKNRDFWGSKVQIFGAEDAENFEKIVVFNEKLAVFCTFGRKFDQILIDIVILD